MSRGIRVGRIFGITISVDYTWFIVFALFAWSLASGYFPYRHPGFGKGEYVVMGVVSSFLLFACVLIHEISHSYVSNRLGVKVDEIMLFIFGGVARLTREPDDPVVELKIALAGPLASAVLAVMFRVAASVAGSGASPFLGAILSYLAMINVVLLVFNMIPGFPLDGGRVLRALWWMKTGGLTAATRVASRVGKAFAVVLIVLGVIQVLTGNFTGFWSIFIGVFLRQAAGSSYEELVVKQMLDGVKVGDLMSREVVTMDESVTVAEAVEEYFFKHHYASYPVVSLGRPVGLLTLAQVRGLPREEWAATRVGGAMRKLAPEDLLSPDSPALDALVKMTNDGAGRLIVAEAGSIAGIISRRDIMKVMEFRSGLK
ncbi:MAG: site-2 protease family protein [Deltaproteobacteria bacterium]|nr:site-2 protease family protein [Deltaproteobacteria bacterium]